MNIVLLLAGGAGNRMGQDIPKQFLHVENKPVILYTMEVLEQHSEVDRIQAVCVEGWEKILAGYASQFNITKLFSIVPGGETRYWSTRKGMTALGEVGDDDVIVVHDAVRPLVPDETLSDVIHTCKREGNSMAVIGCEDTMYHKTADAFTNATADRDRLVRGQTPEAVTGKRMREMYRASDEKNIRDDSISALQNRLGWEIHFARGSARNIKLTRTEDIELFKALLKVRKDTWLK